MTSWKEKNLKPEVDPYFRGARKVGFGTVRPFLVVLGVWVIVVVTNTSAKAHGVDHSRIDDDCVSHD